MAQGSEPVIDPAVEVRTASEAAISREVGAETGTPSVEVRGAPADTVGQALGRVVAAAPAVWDLVAAVVLVVEVVGGGKRKQPSRSDPDGIKTDK